MTAASSTSSNPGKPSLSNEQAVGETFVKLTSQALKPLNTVAYGWQDMQSQEGDHRWQARQANQARQELEARVRWQSIDFSEMQHDFGSAAGSTQAPTEELLLRRKSGSRPMRLQIGTMTPNV